ncbi:hypothetical protein GT347_18340 [Xylophilus rhododendri]|uniref:Uncharacterized protein n=1 Tax=Xylophilus rhododendri TaxID=2697032 RepID=A0A857JAJ6_9BURK|nr:hypothetical protein [Xylophilus rhododendri]QHI99765.1 hypothetical protein GT347_18340 [Xylophilus rhododendri]
MAYFPSVTSLPVHWPDGNDIANEPDGIDDSLMVVSFPETEAGADHDRFRPVSPRQRSHRLQPTPQDIADALHASDEEPASREAALRLVMQQLRARGLRLRGGHVDAWLALVRPELHADRWPGLAQLRDELLDACRRRPALLRDSTVFRGLIATRMRGASPALRRFVAAYESAVIHYLAQQVKGDIADRPLLSRLMGTNLHDSQQKLQAGVALHAQAIQDCVQAMAGYGFPTAMVELDMLLQARQLRLNLRQMLQLPQLIPALDYAAGWFFPRDQAPRRFLGTRMVDKSLALFRGEAAAGTQAGVRGGFAYELLCRYPGGCTIGECELLLAQYATGLHAAERRAHMRNFRRRFLQSLDGQRLRIHPDIVCEPIRQLILENRPPRAPPTGHRRGLAASRRRRKPRPLM